MSLSSSRQPSLGAIGGKVYGGQQPIAGALIQLYAAGSSGDGSAAKPLIGATVTTSDGTGNSTDANANEGNGFNSLPIGYFTISGTYTCASSAEVYLTAVGGNPGLPEGGNNPQIALMATLGPCGSLSSATNVDMNEVTTVGSIAALYPYITSYAGVGSGSGDASALQNAYNLVNEYVSIAAGQAPGPALPAGYYASSKEIDTLANILATCINSSGGTSGDKTPCGDLFQDSTPANGTAPTDTIGATIEILQNPMQNVGALFNLVGATPPFEPSSSSAPPTWALPILPIPDTPTFAATPRSGSFTVAIAESDNTASVYYTTDGSTPSSQSTAYSGPIAVGASETLKAIAIESGRLMSAVGSVAYTVNLPTTPTPTFSLAAGSYAGSQSVAISSIGSASAIDYMTTSVVPSANGTPNSTVWDGTYEFVSVQGTGQIFTYTIASGVQVQQGSPYAMPCNDPSGMVLATIGGVETMAVVCYDTGSLSTLTVNSDGSLTALGSVSGLSKPYPGIVLNGTDVLVPLFGNTTSVMGQIAKVSIAAPATPLIVGTVTLASSSPGEYVNPSYMALSGNDLYVCVGSETAPLSGSSSIQVVDVPTMTLVGTPLVVDHSPQQIAIAGNVAYIAIYDAQEVESIDISDPAQLQALEVLSLPTVGPDCLALSVAVDGASLYVGCYIENKIEVFDASNPANLELRQTIAGVRYPQGIVSAGQYMLVPASVTGGTVTEIGNFIIAASVGSGTATVYYTTDSTVPTTLSTRYSGPLAVSASETVQAIAIETGMNVSAVGSAAYTIH